MIWRKNTVRIHGRAAESVEIPGGYRVVVYQKRRDCKRIKNTNYECQENCGRLFGPDGHKGNGLFLYVEYCQPEKVTYLLLPPFEYFDRDMEDVARAAEKGSHKSGFDAVKEYCESHKDIEKIQERGKRTYKLEFELNRREVEDILCMECGCGLASYDTFEEYKDRFPGKFREDVEKTLEGIGKKKGFFEKHIQPVKTERTMKF